MNLVQLRVVLQFVFDLERELCFAGFYLLLNFFVDRVDFLHYCRLLADRHLGTLFVHPVRDREVFLDSFLCREKHFLVGFVLSLAVDLDQRLNVLSLVVQAF